MTTHATDRREADGASRHAAGEGSDQLAARRPVWAPLSSGAGVSPHWRLDREHRQPPIGQVPPQIHEHLDECGPCLREYGLEELVKKLVHKCCGHESVPEELRAKVLVRIAAVRAEIETTEVLAE